MSDNPFLRSLVPHNAQRRRYAPTVGGYITLALPGETTRAKVLRVASDDACVVQLESPPMSRTHTYRKGDTLPVRRGWDDFLGTEKWEVVDERTLDQAEAAVRFEEEERQRIEREQQAAASPDEAPPALPDPSRDNWSA